jgi:ATP-dependent Clp protease ATP-binding subunit ClpC
MPGRKKLRTPEEVNEQFTPGAARLLDLIAGGWRLNDPAVAGQERYLRPALAVVLERHAPMIEDLVVLGVSPRVVLEDTLEQIAAGETGHPLNVDELVAKARRCARRAGRSRTSERDVVYAMLVAVGWLESPSSPFEAVVKGTEKPVVKKPLTVKPDSSQLDSSQPGASTTGESKPQRPEVVKPRVVKPKVVKPKVVIPGPTPNLETFARNLTEEARAGRLPAFVGREDEIQRVVETLCRRTKRNPLLIGAPGVGKTAIIEGLARQIVKGAVPSLPKFTRVYAIQPSDLISEAESMADFSTRVHSALEEAAQPGILLFIDEIHAALGDSGSVGSGELTRQLKPALARGAIACIGATTDEEYRTGIETDAALARRFQVIQVGEPAREAVLSALRSAADELQGLRNVRVDDSHLEWFVDFAGQQMRGRSFPDKAIDLLEQSVACAAAAGQHILTAEVAESVSRRVVGMPVDIEQRLPRLRDVLGERSLLQPDEADRLVNRLGLTVRGLDAVPARPNAVILLAGAAAANVRALADTVACMLLDAPDRVVDIDLGNLTQEYQISSLVGSAPGYVGFGRPLAIHRVGRTPWCVICFRDIDRCHPTIRHAVEGALTSGVLADSSGRPIYLSDAVVIITSSGLAAAERPIGFNRPMAAVQAKAGAAVEREFGAGLASAVDLVCTGPAAPAQAPPPLLLRDIASRYRRHGIQVCWDGSVTDWMSAGQAAGPSDAAGWGRLLDEGLAPAMLPHLRTGSVRPRRSVTVYCDPRGIYVQEDD